MATVDKNFKIKNGLVVEGSTATINGNSVVTDADTSDILAEGTTNLFHTDQRVKDVLTGATQTNISITEVEGVLIVTAENGVDDSTTDDIAEGTNNLYFTNQRALDGTDGAYDPSGSAAAAEANAQTHTNNLIGDQTVDGTTGNTVFARIETAISNLVDSAPETLDTLRELAEALGDDPNFATTITNSISEKVSKAGSTMTGELALPSVLVNSVAKTVAASGSVETAGTTTAIAFSKQLFRSAEFLVKAANGTHSEISKVMITLDGSDNIAISEYGIVSTNGSLMTISADIVENNVRLRVTTAANNTVVTASGTLLI